MAVVSGPVIDITATGTYDVLLGTGDYVINIEATNWDSSSVTVQESLGEGFVDSDDPYNTGSALTRTANGKNVRVAGGQWIRFNCTTLGGSAVGVKAIVKAAE